MRNSIRRGSGRLSFRVLSASWISPDARTASTGLVNSASTLSPAVFTTRPSCSSMIESTTARWAASRRSVPSSSASMSR